MQRVVDEEVTLCAEHTAAERAPEHLDRHTAQSKPGQTQDSQNLDRHRTVKTWTNRQDSQSHVLLASVTPSIGYEKKIKLTKTYNFVLQLSLTTVAEPETKGRSTIKKTEDLMAA